MRVAVRRGPFGALLAIACGLVVASPAPGRPEVAAQTATVANPPMADSCGTDVTLVLDASGSIQSSQAVEAVRRAGEAFLDALADTGSTARVTQFGTFSQQLAAQAEVTSASLLDGGVFRAAINGYYNPIPPRPGDVDIYSWQNNRWQVSNSSNQYTNWDASLAQAAQPQAQPTELVVYVTDGDPTAYNFDQAGDPGSPGPPPDVGVRNDATGIQAALNRAVPEADSIKRAGTRMLVVGVGEALGNAGSQQRLKDISGPQLVTDANIGTITSINQVDVAAVREFNRLAQFLRSVVSELCSPSLSIRKLAQTPGDADYTTAQNWQLTVTPTVSGGTFAWILPDTDPVARPRCGNPTDPDDELPRSCLTNASGLANFQWEPDPSTADSSATVVETVQPGYTAGRPGANNDWKCNIKDVLGQVTPISGELVDNGFSLPVDAQEIITCEIYNSFVYDPEIALTKVDTPTQVRGDLAPPANTVTSTFSVTNPGNTPLASVTLIDNRCTPVFQSGDTNGDDLLAEANGETWIYTCTRNPTATPGSAPRTIVNDARVDAVDPTGEPVFATASATVTAYAPQITLTKTAAPSDVAVGVATPVAYTYRATNTGNMTLQDVTVVDATPPTTCAPVTPASVASLAPGAFADFTCTATLTAATPDDTFTNTATATGNPIFPDGTAAPPAVTAQATATVSAFQPGILLTKAVAPAVVFPGTPVTYTYTVTNTTTNPAIGVVRTDAPPPPPADPRDGWIVDARGPTGTCAPVDYVSGDTNDDNVLDVGETWIYNCTTTIDGAIDTVRNTAVVVGETVGSGITVSDIAHAVVEVVRPSISLEKTSVRPVVLDPAAPAVGGPDVPLRAPAVYLYTVHNTGNVPVRNVVVDDVYPLQGGNTCPVEPVLQGPGVNAGDTNVPPNGLHDPGESWQFMCVLSVPAGGGPPLTKADADDPPGFDPLAPSPVTNTATATGEAYFTPPGGTEQTFAVESNTVTALVEVISPSVQLTKSACLDDGTGTLNCLDDLLVRPATDVTYRYLVANTGDSDLRPLTGVDDQCAPVTFVGGDVNGDDLINGGSAPETWEYRCTMEVGLPGPIVNTAAVLVAGPLGNTYFDDDTATVRFFEPAIGLTKSVSAQFVPAGTQVTYTFEVVNAGTVTGGGVPAEVVLSDILLLDASTPANPSCRTPTFVSGDDGDGLLELEPAETWVYQCTGVINEVTIDVAGVRGLDIQGGPVVDFDSAAVAAFHPAIEVVKAAAPTQLLGSGPVTYTYTVRNTGDVPLGGVAARITDDRCSPVTYVSGDQDGDGLLDTPTSLFEDALDEIWTFTCTTTVSATTTNTVVVTGTPTGPGGVPLCGTPAPAGESRLMQVPGACDATGNSTATVTIVAPATVVIVKRTPEPTAARFSFTIGDQTFTLGRDESHTLANVAPGTYTVTEPAAGAWRLVSIECVDATGDSVSSVGDRQVAIVVAPAETVTCTFTNAPSGSLPATGNRELAATLAAAVALVGLGGLLAAVDARRRRALAR